MNRFSKSEEDKRDRVIEIFPSLHCNYRCSHCYTSSSPNISTQSIKASSYESFLKYAFRSGFSKVFINGGEPLLYPGITDLIETVKKIGFKLTISTNATTLFTPPLIDALKKVDTLEVSIDGIPELHNEIRNNAFAFENMVRGLNQIKAINRTFGFSHTITCKSWDSLLWLGEFAYDHGASFLNLNPLQMRGRATNEMLALELDQITLHKVYFLNQYLQNKYEGKMEIDINVMHKPVIEQTPSVFYVYPEIKKYGSVPLPEIFNKIIIDENGDILPVSHGFSSQFLISNIHFYQKNHDVFSDFMLENGKLLKNFLMQTYWKIINEKDRDFFNTDEELVRESWKCEILQTA